MIAIISLHVQSLGECVRNSKLQDVSRVSLLPANWKSFDKCVSALPLSMYWESNTKHCENVYIQNTKLVYIFS